MNARNASTGSHEETKFMGKVSETFKVNRENDDSYVVVRTISEKIDAKALVKISDGVMAGVKEIKAQLEGLPAQTEAMRKDLERQLGIIEERSREFGKHQDAAERAIKKEAWKTEENGIYVPGLKPDKEMKKASESG